MADKLLCRVWKQIQSLQGAQEWFNTYIIETSAPQDTAAWYETIHLLPRGEQHIHLPDVIFKRIDCAPCDDLGMIASDEGFSTVRFEGTGIRDTEGHGGLSEEPHGLLMLKDTYTGKAGRVVYRGVFHGGEVDTRNKDGLRWDATDKWIFFHYKWYRELLQDSRMTHFVARREANSDLIKGYSPIYTFAVGNPIKLATLTQAQSRKRGDASAAHGMTLAAMQMASEAWWSLHDQMAAYGDSVPQHLCNEGFGKAGGAIAGYQVVKDYFENFEAPPYNSTRWERPRADPHRAKASQAVAKWKALEPKLQQQMQQLHPDPATGNLPRAQIEAIQDLARQCCAWCNVVYYSRFT